jgi:hypothetical protein
MTCDSEVTTEKRPTKFDQMVVPSTLLLTAKRCLERFNAGLSIAREDLLILNRHALPEELKLRVDDLAWHIIGREFGGVP